MSMKKSNKNQSGLASVIQMFLKQPTVFIYAVFQWIMHIDSHKAFICFVIQDAILWLIFIMYRLSGKVNIIGTMIILGTIILQVVMTIITVGIPRNKKQLIYLLTGKGKKKKKKAVQQQVVKEEPKEKAEFEPQTEPEAADSEEENIVVPESMEELFNETAKECSQDTSEDESKEIELPDIAELVEDEFIEEKSASSEEYVSNLEDHDDTDEYKETQDVVTADVDKPVVQEAPVSVTKEDKKEDRNVEVPQPIIEPVSTPEVDHSFEKQDIRPTDILPGNDDVIVGKSDITECLDMDEFQKSLAGVDISSMESDLDITEDSTDNTSTESRMEKISQSSDIGNLTSGIDDDDEI